MLIAYLVLLCEFFGEFSIFLLCRPLVDIYWHPLLKCHEIYFLPLAPELRLGDSPVPYAGRVELRIKGIWGTIFQYYRYYLRPGATRVICRQLGFSDAVISAGYSVYGPGVGPVWLRSNNLRGCLGHEKNILNCSNSSPHFTTSVHHGDASVVCKPNTSHTSGK